MADVDARWLLKRTVKFNGTTLATCLHFRDVGLWNELDRSCSTTNRNEGLLSIGFLLEDRSTDEVGNDLEERSYLHSVRQGWS